MVIVWINGLFSLAWACVETRYSDSSDAQTERTPGETMYLQSSVALPAEYLWCCEELVVLCLTAQVLNGWSAHWWPNLCPHSSKVKLCAMYTGDRLFVPSVCCTSIFSDMLGSNNPLDCSLIFVFKQSIGDVANCLLCTHILGIGELWSFSGYCTQIDEKK